MQVWRIWQPPAFREANATARDQPVGPGFVDRQVREDPSQEGANQSAHQVHAHHVERIVVTQLELQADRPRT